MNQPKQMDKKAVLVIGEVAPTVREVVEWVAAETDSHLSAASSQQAVGLMEKHSFQLVLFCSETLEESEKARDALAAALERAGQGLPVFVVLCTKQEMEASFRRCDQGSFDNYVVFRPLYDPFRLQLVLRESLRLLRAERRTQELGKEMQAVRGTTLALGQATGEFVSESGQLRDRTSDRLDLMLQRLQADVSEILRSLEDGDDAGTGTELAGQLRSFCEQKLAAELSDAGQQINEWNQELVAATAGQQNRLQQELLETCDQSLRKGTTIFLVDDEDMARGFTRKLLEMNGFEVLEANGGKAGIAGIISQRPDLVLLDLEMPDVNGEEVARCVLEHPRSKGIPIIMLTGNAAKDKVIGLARIGVSGYVIKPPQIDRLLKQIERVLAETQQ